MDPWIVVIVAGVAALVGGMIWIGKVEEKRRTVQMGEAAAAMGFAFEPQIPLEVLKTFGELPLYDQGHGERVRNVMTGRLDGHDVKFLDYAYTFGTGKSQHTYLQSVALYPRGAADLPDLDLTPETFLDRIASAFGAQDIDFDASPEFSRHYVLKSADETAARAAFTTDALTFFATRLHWRVEVRGGTIGIYRCGRYCAPAEAKATLAEAHAVFRALVRD